MSCSWSFAVARYKPSALFFLAHFAQRPAKKDAADFNCRTTPNDPALNGWIGKEASLAVKGGPVVISPADDVQSIEHQSVSEPVSLSAASLSSGDDDEETRELS